MTKLLKTVTVTKTVAVTDIVTLTAWLDHELSGWLTGQRDGGANKNTAGRKAIDLILEAGFTIHSPKVTRQ